MLENIAMLNDVANDLQAKIDEVRKKIGTVGDNGELDLLNALPEQIKELNGYLNALKRCEDDAARIIKVVRTHQPEVVGKVMEKFKAMKMEKMGGMKQPNVQQPKTGATQPNAKTTDTSKSGTTTSTDTKTTSTDSKTNTTKTTK